MAEQPPIACSLDASALRERLAEIEAVGAKSLIDRSREGERHVLRFRRDCETERRLEAIVVAESRCCAFLDLELTRRDGELVLTLAAPAGGEEIARELAASFAGRLPIRAEASRSS
jgi:hypothetical protein